MGSVSHAAGFVSESKLDKIPIGRRPALPCGGTFLLACCEEIIVEKKLRTFVAIDLPESLQNDIRMLQNAFASRRLDVRWVKPANVHLTIKFMGDVDRLDIETAARILSETAANHPKFDLVPRGVGVFPSIKRPRVLWAGIAGQTDVLRSVQTSVDNAMVSLGIKADKRPFRGHLTIGRIKTHIQQDRLATALRTHQGFASEMFPVERLVLFKSELQPGGPVYTRLQEIPLGNLSPS